MTEYTLSPLDWVDELGRGISGTLKAAIFVCCNLIGRFGNRLNIHVVQHSRCHTQLHARKCQNLRYFWYFSSAESRTSSSELLDTVIVLYQLVFYFKQAAICSIVYASNLIKSYPIFRINFAIFLLYGLAFWGSPREKIKNWP